MLDFVLALGSLLLLWLISCLINLHRNYVAARSSGLKTIIVPFNLASIPWAIIQPLILPFLDRLPKRWTEPWLPFLSMDRTWSYGHAAFAGVGTDTLLAVSAWGIVLHTCDPEDSSQFFRGNEFEKPAKLLAPLNIYGPTMTGTKRQETRLYRKITAPFFNEATMRRVWEMSMKDAGLAGSILSTKSDSKGCEDDKIMKRLRPVLGKMSLHIVNGICFETDRNCEEELNFRAKAEEGHTLSYSTAMHTVMDNLRELFAIPRTILKYSGLNHTEQQFKPMTSSKNLLVSSQMPPALGLSPKAVKGNVFLFMFAGHEANANTLTFALLLLAMHPSLQRSMQQQISELPAIEDYAKAYPAAMGSLVGAVINEALRLYTVIPFVLKSTWSNPQAITLENRRHLIPADTLILMHTNATHRNPKFWPEPGEGALEAGGMPHPVAAFNPRHWLERDNGGRNGTGLLKPKPGSYFPFSEGTRGCLGKKFSLVELCAAVVRLFAEYSVELAVEGVTPATGQSERKAKWAVARGKAEYEMSAGVEFNMSLRLTGEVPLRFVTRGSETFASAITEY